MTTNSLLKNIGWAKKGILSFSNTPLNILSFAGVIAVRSEHPAAAVAQVVGRLLFPQPVPPGLTTDARC